MMPPQNREPPMQRLVDEISFLAFLLPRQAVQTLSRRLPLAKLRDRLPRFIGERLRMGLYPARITDPLHVVCAREHKQWGDPPALDSARRVHYDAPPRASILVVTYGNLDLTRLCLCSVQRSAGATPFEIIVVDNSSSDGTPQYLDEVERSGLLPLRVIKNRDNVGFAAANNQAAALACGDVLVFLNNDTVVRPGWLDAMVAALDADPSIGLLGPVTNSCGNEAQLGTRYADLSEMERFAAEYCAAHRGEQAELPMLTLFCAAMPRSLFDELGGLDTRYGAGMFEDDDLGMAVLRKGKRLVLLRDVFVHHYGGAAFSKLPAREYLRLFYMNRRYFERKWRTTWKKR
jgi:GT2 family glycosyltransferase